MLAEAGTPHQLSTCTLDASVLRAHVLEADDAEAARADALSNLPPLDAHLRSRQPRHIVRHASPPAAAAAAAQPLPRR